MKLTNKYVAIANTFGTLGYLSVLLQWSWAGLLLIYPALSTRPEFLFPEPQPITSSSVELGPAFTPIMTIIALIVTVIIVVVTLITLVRLPKRIGQGGATLTHSVAKSTLPILTRHKKITKKERQKLSYKVALLLKVCFILLPCIAILFVPKIAHLEPMVIWSIMLFCAAWSVCYFALQQLIAILARVNKNMLW